MNPALLARILALVPERTARVQTGTRFAAGTTASPHPERIAHLARQLTWMTPLFAQDKDSQQRLGLLNAAGRPITAPEESDGGPGDALPEEAEDAVA